MIKIEKDLLIEDIKNRLEFFGYTLQEEDEFALGFVINTVKKSIKNFCNREDIPDELYEVLVNRVCGEFLNEKKGTGKLKDFDFAVAEKSIRIGDTTIDFAVNSNLSPEANFDRLLKILMTTGESDLVSFRKLRW